MDLDLPAEVDEVRAEVRAWLAAHLPTGWLADPGSVSLDERAEVAAGWSQRLFEGRWICPTWPRGYGGRGLSTIEAVAVDEELARARVPLRGASLGEALVGPVLLRWGTEAQRRAHLPGILSGEAVWCQGFSEPDAGSDLAGLRTSARLDGETWVINGQKVWTSMAGEADHIFLLARTDPDAPRHKGLSCLLVDMHQPGIEVRPLVRLDRSDEFSEVFFADVRCPRASTVGPVNGGWQVANTALADERGSSTTTSHHRFEHELEDIVALARANGRAAEPLARQRLAAAWSAVQILRFHWLRSLTAALSGRRDPGVDAVDAIQKLYWTEYHRDVTNLAMDLLGPDAQILSGHGPGTYIPGVGMGGAGESYPAGPLQASFLFSRSETIWGGSSEIQRNIIAERVLGLPH